jgi:hypothetical protein
VNRNIGRGVWNVAHRNGLLQYFTYCSLPTQEEVCMEMKMKDVKMNK